MSMADAEKAEQTPDSMEVDEKDEDYSDVMNDPAFLTSVLQNLPGDQENFFISSFGNNFAREYFS